MVTQTPELPCYAVIVTNQRMGQSADEDNGYAGTAERTLAREQGRNHWYGQFSVRVAKVERAYGMAPQGERL